MPALVEILLGTEVREVSVRFRDTNPQKPYEVTVTPMAAAEPPSTASGNSIEDALTAALRGWTNGPKVAARLLARGPGA